MKPSITPEERLEILSSLFPSSPAHRRSEDYLVLLAATLKLLPDYDREYICQQIDPRNDWQAYAMEEGHE